MAKVLVVDDEKSNVDVLTNILNKNGHEVVPAYNGREGLEKAKTVGPDLIILDIMMPEMDGYTVHNRLFEADTTKHIPVIMLTSKGQMREVFEPSSNVSAYMEKPYDPGALLKKINDMLTPDQSTGKEQ